MHKDTPKAVGEVDKKLKSPDLPDAERHREPKDERPVFIT
jgi:hypothetical protein